MKDKDKERAERLYQEYLDFLPKIKAILSEQPERDKNGCFTSSYLHKHYSLGLLTYAVKKDKKAFKSYLKEAVLTKLKLYERCKAGDPIDYNGVLDYQEVFMALAAGHFELAIKLAQEMGAVSEEQKKHYHPFDRGFFEAVREFVLGSDTPTLKAACEKIEKACEKKQAFHGYAKLFWGIFKNDLVLAQEGLEELAKGHRRLRSIQAIFGGIEAFLNTWGLGMANLARWRGLAVDIDDEYLPRELLVEVGGGVK